MRTTDSNRNGVVNYQLRNDVCVSLCTNTSWKTGVQNFGVCDKRTLPSVDKEKRHVFFSERGA